jgi:hypothetical protein
VLAIPHSPKNCGIERKREQTKHELQYNAVRRASRCGFELSGRISARLALRGHSPCGGGPGGDHGDDRRGAVHSALFASMCVVQSELEAAV